MYINGVKYFPEMTLDDYDEEYESDFRGESPRAESPRPLTPELRAEIEKSLEPVEFDSWDENYIYIGFRVLQKTGAYLGERDAHLPNYQEDYILIANCPGYVRSLLAEIDRLKALVGGRADSTIFPGEET